MVLSESVVLTMVSGMAGITLAVMILQTMENLFQIDTPDAQFQISFWVALGALSLLAALGVLAGLVPAMRAMKIRPVDAMREE
jgi:putative ABC transport system permease protein